MSTLTGRTRYRTGWFGRLILQVEFRYVVDPLNINLLRFIGPDLQWRDARRDDFEPADAWILRALKQAHPLPPARSPRSACPDHYGPTDPACTGTDDSLRCQLCGK